MQGGRRDGTESSRRSAFLAGSAGSRILLAAPGPLTLRGASCTMNLLGRLAQRLEHSVYTRKVVRSNRTLPTTSGISSRSDVVQLVSQPPCPTIRSRVPRKFAVCHGVSPPDRY